MVRNFFNVMVEITSTISKFKLPYTCPSEINIIIMHEAQN